MISVLCYSGVRAGREMGRAAARASGRQEDMNTRRMNYARAPHCTQNWPFNGAPQALQKL